MPGRHQERKGQVPNMEYDPPARRPPGQLDAALCRFFEIEMLLRLDEMPKSRRRTVPTIEMKDRLPRWIEPIEELAVECHILNSCSDSRIEDAKHKNFPCGFIRIKLIR